MSRLAGLRFPSWMTYVPLRLNYPKRRPMLPLIAAPYTHTLELDLPRLDLEPRTIEPEPLPSPPKPESLPIQSPPKSEPPSPPKPEPYTLKLPPTPPPSPQATEITEVEEAEIEDSAKTLSVHEAEFELVLDPFLPDFAGRIHPLIALPVKNGLDEPHLEWNMLFPSSHCRRSTDFQGVLWHEGRDDPATDPPLPSINIICRRFPQIRTQVSARNHFVGVTCGDVIDALSIDLQQMLGKSESNPQGERTRLSGDGAYNKASHGHGHLLRGDTQPQFLGTCVMFGGIYQDDRLVKHLLGGAMSRAKNKMGATPHLPVQVT
ncbi:hypothetical protein DXG01_006057 [Tephrocybe rancida]|nr:hypothetical protein DXG01_006057 [Tephrocybe rancida]